MRGDNVGAVDIAERENLLANALHIRDFCSGHRESMHVCGCPFSVGGVCALHFNYPDDWPDLRGMTR